MNAVSAVISLLRLVNQIHVHLSKYSLSSLPPDRPSSRFDALSDRTGPDIARTIDRTLQALLQSRAARITALRASVIYPFAKDDKSWPMIEWREDNGSRVLAIFALDDEDDPKSCSYIMHTTNSAAQSSRLTDVTFNVSDFTIMKTLFRAAQHVWGLLQMPKEDAVMLYCETHESPDYSTEKYISRNASDNVESQSTLGFCLNIFNELRISVLRSIPSCRNWENYV